MQLAITGTPIYSYSVAFCTSTHTVFLTDICAGLIAPAKNLAYGSLRR